MNWFWYETPEDKKRRDAYRRRAKLLQQLHELFTNEDHWNEWDELEFDIFSILEEHLSRPEHNILDKPRKNTL